MTTLRFPLAVLLAGFWSGCANQTDEPGTGAKEAKADAADYVYVDGGISSRVPRRIKIDDLSRATLRGSHPSNKVTRREDIEELLRYPMPASRGSMSFP